MPFDRTPLVLGTSVFSGTSICAQWPEFGISSSQEPWFLLVGNIDRNQYLKTSLKFLVLSIYLLRIYNQNAMLRSYLK